MEAAGIISAQIERRKPKGRRKVGAIRRRVFDHADGGGRIIDRKTLRKTFASHLIAAGVKPRELQLLMRHADIRTTMRHYSNPALVDLRGALTSLIPARPGAQAEAAG